MLHEKTCRMIWPALRLIILQNCILPKSYGGTAVNQFGDCVQNGNLNDIYPCRHQASTDIGRCKKQGNGCTPYKTGTEELGNVVKYADCSA